MHDDRKALTFPVSAFLFSTAVIHHAKLHVGRKILPRRICIAYFAVNDIDMKPFERKDLNSFRNEKILYAAVWTITAVLPVILELWKLINNSEFEWQFVFRWWIGMIPLILIFIIHNHFLIPKFMKKGRMKRYCLILLLILSAYGGVQYLIDTPTRKEFKEMGMRPRPPFEPEEARHMPPPSPGGPGRPMEQPPRPFPFPILFKIMLAAMTMGMNAAISLSFTYNREQANRREQENKRLQEELKYLKQQISPHFLMNVLNNIHEMAEEDTKEAQNMILELSDLMRYVLYESDNEMTTLSAESRFVSSYVSLMKKRYVESIVMVSLSVQENASKDIRIPPLLFIPFIENAFKHGVSYSNETKIDIKLNEMNGNIMFSCDNSIPRKKVRPQKGGVGLSNVRRRLDLLYGNRYSLRIHENEEKYSVTLIIPSR